MLDLKDYIDIKIWKDSVEISELKPRGLSLLRLKWVRNTVGFKILEQIFYGNILDVEDFIEKNFIGRSTYFRYFNKIKMVADNYKLYVHSNGKISGKEIEIRSFFLDLTVGFFGGEIWPFTMVSLSEVNRYIDNIKEVTGLKFAPLEEIVLSYWLGISLSRVKRGAVISKEKEPNKNNFFIKEKRTEEFDKEFFYNKFFIFLKSNLLKVNAEISNDTYIFEGMFYLVLAHGVCLFRKDSYDSKILVALLLNIDSEIIEAAAIWISEFEKCFQVKLSSEDFALFKKNLMSLLAMHFNIKGTGTFPVNTSKIIYLIEEQVSGFTENFERFKMRLKKYKKFRNIFQKNEAILNGRYLLLILYNVDKLITKLNISIVMQHGKLDEFSIKDSLPNSLTHTIQFIPYDMEKTEIILADSYYLNLSIDNPRYICIDKNPTIKSWNRILDLGFELRDRK